jgi:signal transduction histidine kinase
MASYIAVRLRQAEHPYRQANILLQEKNYIKDEYVMRVTHDIKGHLATIKSCLGVIVNKMIGPLDGKQAELVERAYTRTVKLTNFVEGLLKLTKTRLSDEMEMDVFSLSNTIDNVVAAVVTKAEDKSITLIHNVESSADIIIGNRLSIEEAIANLVLNAIKYTPENGTIEINITNHDDCVLVEISDTGIGIPQEELPMVFDEFYRATNAKRVEKDGTGLGLSIAKHVIERHNGRIWVESAEGVGTKFSFTLPKTTTSSETGHGN